MRRSALLLIAAAAVLAQLVGACGRLDLDWAEFDSPGPEGALVADVPPFETGNGQDGDLIVEAGDKRVVSDCRGLTSGAGSTLNPASVVGLVAGNLYLILQMQADFATAGPTADVTSPATAGNWELRRVVSVGATTATLASALVGTYTSAGTSGAQMCSVPEYGNATIAGDLEAASWDGTRGGVIALLVSGTLDLEGRIDADAVGFRGGVVSSNNSFSDITSETTGIGNGGGRGEGLDGRSFSQHGRGAMANAAGGGNAANAGGGGGGGGGAGGFGGKQYSPFGEIPATQGRPGGRLVRPVLERLSFGGGGGGGQQNNTQATPGGRGGGIVFLFAGALSGTGTVSANGADAASTAVGALADGAGGGGGGGTILLRTGTAFWGTISAHGGAGGDIRIVSVNHYGGGGGGGGGRIAAPEYLFDRADVAGGRCGVNADDGEPWGATDGSDGVVESSF